MLEVAIPTKEKTKEVCRALLSGELTRQEVYNWLSSILEEIGDTYPGFNFGTKDRTVEYVLGSLMFLLDKGVSKFEDEDDFFIREYDLLEYISIIDSVDRESHKGGVKFVRGHQFDGCVNGPNSAQIGFVIDSSELLDRLSGVGGRGNVDDLNRHVEFAFIEYRSCFYYLEVWLDGFGPNSPKTYVMLSANVEKDYDFAALMNDLGYLPHKELWVSESIERGEFVLCRSDDYGHSYEMWSFETKVEAEIEKYRFDAKGHKQCYTIKEKVA